MSSLILFTFIALKLFANVAQADNSCQEYDLRLPGESMHNMEVRDQMDQSICYGTSAAQAMDAYLNTKFQTDTPWVTSDMDAAIDGTIVAKIDQNVREFMEANTPANRPDPQSSDDNFCYAKKSDLEKIFRDNRNDPRIQKLREMLEVGLKRDAAAPTLGLPYELGRFCEAYNGLKLFGACSESFRVKQLKEMTLARNKAEIIHNVAAPFTPESRRLVKPLNLQKMFFDVADCIFSKDKPRASGKFMAQAYSLKAWTDEVFLQSFHDQCPPSLRRALSDAPACHSEGIWRPWWAAMDAYVCGGWKDLNKKLDQAQELAEIQFNRILDQSKPRLPSSISFYASLLLADKQGVEIPTEEVHIAVVIGRRKKGNSCQYLLRNSWGKKCNYKNPKINSNCEAGDVWLDSTDLLPKVAWAQFLK